MEMRGGGGQDGDIRSRKRDDAFVLTGLSDHLRQPSDLKAVRYRECLKNHAANVGGNVVDGCGEFMPSADDGSLKCAACDCHRNFHRKEVEGDTQFSSTCRRSLMVPIPSHHHHFVPPMNVAYCGGTESSSEDLNAYAGAAPYAVVKKRSRTKFTAEQKSRMVEFAERVGWRFQRQDEEEIDNFCGEVGVKRQVLKVWMHNNKNAMKKHPLDHCPVALQQPQQQPQPQPQPQPTLM